MKNKHQQTHHKFKYKRTKKKNKKKKKKKIKQQKKPPRLLAKEYVKIILRQ
jgi:hypothetical protein